VVTLADPDYPQQLLQIPDPPVLLYVRGDMRLLGAASLAIVGSRNATHQGVANAEAFARALSEAGLTIVSGLALGIDAAAHRGGLDGRGSTIAVLGCGADIVYRWATRRCSNRSPEAARSPRSSRLARHLAREFPAAQSPHFGARARCLVVEAAFASGSLITARLAAEQGREVFAIPGSIHSPLSKGCHALIKQGAKLVESAKDVLEELASPPYPRLDAIPRGVGRIPTTYGYDPCTIDALAAAQA